MLYLKDQMNKMLKLSLSNTIKVRVQFSYISSLSISITFMYFCRKHPPKKYSTELWP